MYVYLILGLRQFCSFLGLLWSVYMHLSNFQLFDLNSQNFALFGVYSMIQNAVSVAIGKNRLNAEIAFHIAVKTWFGQLKNLSNAAVSSQIDHILNHWVY